MWTNVEQEVSQSQNIMPLSCSPVEICIKQMWHATPSSSAHLPSLVFPLPPLVPPAPTLDLGYNHPGCYSSSEPLLYKTITVCKVFIETY